MAWPGAVLVVLAVARARAQEGSQELAAFQKLFMAKRIEQLAAVKNIQKLDESKRKLLLDQISVKLFQVSAS